MTARTAASPSAAPTPLAAGGFTRSEPETVRAAAPLIERLGEHL